MRSKTESTTGQTIKPEPKNLQVNPEEFAKKLLEFIPANINKIIDEAEKEYLAKGKNKTREDSFKDIKNELARFHDLNSCLEIFDKFIGTGTWKTNSANTRMIIAAIRCYMEEHSEEYQERDNYFLRAHIVSPVTEALRALIATQKKVKKATEVQITEKDKELEKKREVIFSRLPDVKLFWDIGKIDEVLDKARDYQSINPGHHIFLIRPEPNWQLFWVNLNGARNALPIPKNMLDILYNLGGKFPAEGSDAHSKLKVCCKESLDDSINIYLFREPLEAKKFASEHPDKHSFYLKCSEQATPAKNYKWGVKALEAAKPEYRSLYLEKGENDSLNYVVTRKGSECRLILQSTRPTVEDPAYDNLNFAYILTTDNRLFYLKRLNDGRLEIQQLELIKDGLAILKKEFEIKKGVFLDSVKLELKEKSRVVVEELRRTQKDILESVTNFVPEVPMVKGVINKKDFNSDENWEVLCNALEKGSLPEDPQKEILNNLLEITARKKHTVLTPAKWQLSSYDHQGRVSHMALTNEILREITGPKAAEIPPEESHKFYNLKIALNKLVLQQLDKINLQINPDLSRTFNLSTTYVFHDGIPVYFFADEKAISENFLARLHAACIVTGSGKFLYHSRGEPLRELTASNEAFSGLKQALNLDWSVSLEKGLLITKLTDTQLQIIEKMTENKLVSSYALDWYDTLALEPHSLPLAQYPLLQECLRKENTSNTADPHKIKLFLQPIQIRRLVEASKSKTVQSILESQIRNLMHSPEALAGKTVTTEANPTLGNKASSSSSRNVVANSAKTSSCQLMNTFTPDSNHVYTEFPICSFLLSREDWKLYYFDALNRCFPVEWADFPDIKATIELWQSSEHVVTEEEHEKLEMLLAKISIKKSLEREKFTEVEKYFLARNKGSAPQLPLNEKDSAEVEAVETASQLLVESESELDPGKSTVPPPPPPPKIKKLDPARMSQLSQLIFFPNRGEEPAGENAKADIASTPKMDRTC